MVMRIILNKVSVNYENSNNPTKSKDMGEKIRRSLRQGKLLVVKESLEKKQGLKFYQCRDT